MLSQKFIRSITSIAFLISAPFASADVQILSAIIKDKTIDGAEVIFQKVGQTSVKSTTNVQGKTAFNVPFADDSNVTMIVKKADYSNLVVKCPCNGMTYAISPVMTNLDGMRIVLDWGSSPNDLDSHLYYQNNHVFYEDKKGDLSNLDVDDTDGYGPETITIVKKKSGKKYLYAVHNYTDGGVKGNSSLSLRSRAKVFVYIGSTLVRTFTPPQGKIGNTWVVFGIGDNGEFYDINKFADFSSHDQVGGFMADIVASGDFTSLPEVTTDQRTLANDLNKQGEREYHAGNYASAESFYLDAINNNPEHAQAYSNLGLLYQKMGKKAEGLFANRKAIALANGSNGNVVKASSYYNIARIYEDEGSWSDALNNYQTAKQLRDHDAYNKGIARMNQKLGNR
jgi:hypothetical protein